MVERREANVISRFPFNPSNASTSTVVSGISDKKDHPLARSSSTPAATIPQPAKMNGMNV